MTQERTLTTWNGWPMLGALLVALAGWIGLIIWSATRAPVWGWGLAIGIASGVVWLFLMLGFFTLQPNMSAVLILFGAYRGTSRESGFRWANPLIAKHKVSLRAHNLNGERLKVNDLRGNPVEIAAVVVWRVENTAQAVFDVEDYKEYVEVQSESALRHLASRYPYDTGEDDELSLRGSTDEVSKDLQTELADRLIRAGVTVDEARLTHLAFAPEIAGAMLRRQQAEAIVAARKRIVEGAVGMVELALTQLDEHDTIKLDDERRASMVSNLLVVLCGEREASPVINTGSLYG